jgi:uncharacterized protein YjiS (DUF1127 family)
MLTMKFFDSITPSEYIKSILSKFIVSYSQYKSYTTTIRELNKLSDRELADIGLNRSSIVGIAIETAYGEVK